MCEIVRIVEFTFTGAFARAIYNFLSYVETEQRPIYAFCVVGLFFFLLIKLYYFGADIIELSVSTLWISYVDCRFIRCHSSLSSVLQFRFGRSVRKVYKIEQKLNRCNDK